MTRLAPPVGDGRDAHPRGSGRCAGDAGYEHARHDDASQEKARGEIKRASQARQGEAGCRGTQGASESPD